VHAHERVVHEPEKCGRIGWDVELADQELHYARR